MKCLLISFFNSDNLGDLVISDILYNYVKIKFCTVKMSYGSNPFGFSDINGMDNVRGIKKKQIFKNNLYILILICRLEKILEWYRGNHKNELEIQIEEKIVENDIIIIGGGNMIFDVDKFSCSAKTFKTIIDIAKKSDKKVFAISIGIGPFVTDLQEKKAVDALNMCDVITFRDSKSKEIYNKYYKDKKAILTIDPVFMLPYCVEDNRSKTDNIIAINLFDNRLVKEKQKKYIEIKNGYIELILRILSKTNSKVILFSTDLNDYEMINEVYGEIISSNLEVMYISGFDDLIYLYSKINLLIGCRMHSMIIAYTQHIPVIGFSWQPKVDAFFEIINQQECVFRYDKIVNNIDEILSCCDAKLNNLEYEKEKINTQLKEIRKKFKINEEILLKMSS
ncbi:polysaccharide pyruvyl transferase family protein [Acetobacterium bakii]|uniref:Polysaccharide pyruvyl transferase domain-containing protein n=1 Tax=Acetobacterium bakii TaxID=52689 RepID=A0A0L6U1Y3_9FIRM|nr:polysaccharide pyruvyl transferase family protein [Acetobacterium bakii]KNZ42529.1 hypothetical protein AKG39_06320 [Acetobacterium bakii]